MEEELKSFRLNCYSLQSRLLVEVSTTSLEVLWQNIYVNDHPPASRGIQEA